MIQQLHHFVEKLKAAKTLKQADCCLQDFLLKDCGCQSFVYTGYAKDFRTSHQLNHQLCTPNIAAWHQYYIDHNFEYIDPIGALLRVSKIPIIWRNAELLKEVPEHQKIIYRESIKLGYYNGISIPIHGEQNDFAILVIQENNIDDFLARTPGFIYILHMAVIYYYHTITQLMSAELAKYLIEPLTARELECLSISAQGATAKEVAKKLDVTARTVSFHLENAREKLAVRNKAQAILKAKELGLIT